MEALEALLKKFAMILAVKEELAKLQRRMKQIGGELKKVGPERAEDTAWLNELQRGMEQIDDALKKVGRERAEDTARLNELQSILHEANDVVAELRNSLPPSRRSSPRQKPPTCDAQQRRRNSEMPQGRARLAHHRVLFPRQRLHRR